MAALSRRRFLRGVLGTCGAAGAMKCLGGCIDVERPYIPSPSDAPYEGRAKVSVVRGTDLYAMTREALEAVGGIGSVVHEGETVFVKPNFGGLGFVECNPFVSGESAKVETVITVVEECLRAGARKVIVGEGGQTAVIPWDQAVTLDGSTSLVAEAQRMTDQYAGQVVLASLENAAPYDAVPSPHTDLGEIKVSSLLTGADRVISIAVPKTHRWTVSTGTMKNFVGTIPCGPYGYGQHWRIIPHRAAGSIAQCFLDVVAHVKPDLGLIDGSIGCEGNGPHVMPGWWGETINVADRLGDWFMLAGTDPVALDATMTRIIGQDIDAVSYLTTARDQGLGQCDQSLIDVDGATVNELQMAWKPADHTYGFGDVMMPGFMLQFFSGQACAS